MPASSQPRLNSRAAFAHRDFRFFQAARFLATIGWQMQSVAVGWQVYHLTGRPIDLGYIGLAQFLPAFVLSLVTGHVADRFDRRKVIILCETTLVSCSLALAMLSRTGNPSIAAIYALMAVIGTAQAFLGPASQALMPQLVPAEHFQNAVAWNSSLWQTASMLGPALGGAFYQFTTNAEGVYGMNALLTSCAIALMVALHVRTGRMEKAAVSWRTILAGVHYVWERKIILGAISLDLFAVLLGGAVALVPVFAKELHAGALGMGFMRSAMAVGATITGIAVAHLPPMRRAGAAMLWCVAGFGLATIVFGLSKNIYLSLACLFMLGVTDMVSVVVRHTLVQVMTPPEMRGRVSAVNLIFIGASNELGEFESGVTAQWFGTVPAVVIGGIGTLLVAGLWALFFPDLRRFKRLDTPQEAVEVAAEETVKS